MLIKKILSKFIRAAKQEPHNPDINHYCIGIKNELVLEKVKIFPPAAGSKESKQKWNLGRLSFPASQ